MKNLLYVISLCICTISFGQNYQCLQSGVKNYFTNGNGYLRGIRIDSVRTSGDTIIYYPYHTPRGAYWCAGYGPLDSTGGSWLGKRVLQTTDGTFIFDDIWNANAIIKTQANLGDSWTFYADTTNISYMATVTGLDTMTISGSLDSIKIITITADSGGAVNSTDPVNNFQIKLSKNNGFVQVFDLYTFPYHRPDSIHINTQYFDYYYDLIMNNVPTWDVACFNPYEPIPDTINSIFKLVYFHNPTTMEIYDFNVGDVYESQYTILPGGTGEYIQTTLDTVISKSTTPYSVSYLFSEHQNYENIVVSYPPSTTYGYSVTTSGGGGDTTLLLNMNKLPEEWRAGIFMNYYINPAPDTSPCYSQYSYTINQDNISYSTSGGYVIGESTDFNVVIGINNHSYATGYGQTGMYQNNWYGSGVNDIYSLGYIYVYKGGTVCSGAFVPVTPLKTNALAIKNTFTIFPNPASDELTIKTSTTQPYTISLLNMMGQVVYSITTNNQQETIDVSKLPAGVYEVNMICDDGERYYDKALIMH